MASNSIPSASTDTPGGISSILDDAEPLEWHATTPIPSYDMGFLPTLPTVAKPLYEKLYDDEQLTPQLAMMLEKQANISQHNVARMYYPGARRERGSLDVNVETVCRLGSGGAIQIPISPAIISLMIDPTHPPSHGAIHAVLQRFVAEGWIECDESPVIFKSFKGLALDMTIKEARKAKERALKFRS